MNMKNPAHPGAVFKQTYLIPMGITIKDAANVLGSSAKHISNLVNCKVGITADMAIRISLMTNTSAKLWLGMQNSFDLSQLDMKKYQHIKSENHIPEINL